MALRPAAARVLALLRRECGRHCPCSTATVKQKGLVIKLKGKVDAIMGNFVEGKPVGMPLNRAEKTAFLQALPWLRAKAAKIAKKRAQGGTDNYDAGRHSDRHEAFKDDMARRFAQRCRAGQRLCVFDDFDKGRSQLRQISALLAVGVLPQDICLANPRADVCAAALGLGCVAVCKTMEAALEAGDFGPRCFDRLCLDSCYSGSSNLIRLVDLAVARSKRRAVLSWTMASRHSRGISFLSRFMAVHEHLVQAHGFRRPVDFDASYMLFDQVTTQILDRQ